ncbi:MAG: hypothetical protein NVSMB13_20410 [Mycobacteriales bacterium]
MSGADRPDTAERWRTELAGWAIPTDILAAAPESQYGFPVGMFSAGSADDEPAGDPSRRRALAALADGGSVLDVGCGGGRASMALVPPAGSLVGVDSSQAMLAAYAEAATQRGVRHREVAGSWPEAAAEAGTADVVLAHHVFYNVADLPAFAAALTEAARRRVVVELTACHPWVATNDLWMRFHGLTRPEGPTAALATEVLRAMGLNVSAESWQRPGQQTARADLVAFVRRRLCLPAGADSAVDAALPADFQFAARDVTTLWWDASVKGRRTGGVSG